MKLMGLTYIKSALRLKSRAIFTKSTFVDSNVLTSSRLQRRDLVFLSTRADGVELHLLKKVEPFLNLH
jgi:hypothetical protein